MSHVRSSKSSGSLGFSVRVYHQRPCGQTETRRSRGEGNTLSRVTQLLCATSCRKAAPLTDLVTSMPCGSRVVRGIDRCTCGAHVVESHVQRFLGCGQRPERSQSGAVHVISPLRGSRRSTAEPSFHLQTLTWRWPPFDGGTRLTASSISTVHGMGEWPGGNGGTSTLREQRLQVCGDRCPRLQPTRLPKESPSTTIDATTQYPSPQPAAGESDVAVDRTVVAADECLRLRAPALMVAGCVCVVQREPGSGAPLNGLMTSFLAGGKVRLSARLPARAAKLVEASAMG